MELRYSERFSALTRVLGYSPKRFIGHSSVILLFSISAFFRRTGAYRDIISDARKLFISTRDRTPPEIEMVNLFSYNGVIFMRPAD